MSKSVSDKVVRNHADNVPFSAILQARLSRRTVARGGLSAALALLTGTGLAACGGGDGQGNAPAPVPAPGLKLGFESLPASMTDACVVPAGYVAHVLGPWGTPLNDNAAEWDKDGNNSSTDLLHSTGMHHDGMHYFALEGSSTEGILVVNHEYIDEQALHPAGPTMVGGKRPAEEVRKEINAHGVAVMHIRKSGGSWAIVKNSRYNRRFTSATPMALAGPVSGTDWVKTPFSPTGRQVRGTNNNCGNGTTPGAPTSRPRRTGLPASSTPTRPTSPRTRSAWAFPPARAATNGKPPPGTAAKCRASSRASTSRHRARTP